MDQVSVSALPDWELLRKVSENAILHQLYIDIWKIIPYLPANPYQLKTKNINSLIFLVTLLNVNDIFCFLGLSILERKERTCCILMFFSTELLFKMTL